MIIASEMVANVWKIIVEPGTRVEEGETLMILESMKMEIPITAPAGGGVVEIHVEEGQVVQEGDALVRFE